MKVVVLFMCGQVKYDITKKVCKCVMYMCVCVCLHVLYMNTVCVCIYIYENAT